MPNGWRWDETLYRGSAPFYVRGRVPYAPGLAERLAAAAGLDGSGRLLDVGCGPGVLTLPLAPFFAEAVGADADAEMLAHASRRAADAGIANTRWVRALAEDLPAGLGNFRMATFGQSFHWMDRPRVAAVIFAMLEPDGVFVHVADVKNLPAASGIDLPFPGPPHDAIRELVRRYLGPVRRAGQGVLLHGTPDGEASILSGAGFAPPERLRIPAGAALVRGADDIVAGVYSRSDSAPHLFAAERDAFEAELRRLLLDASPSGWFAEQPPDTDVVIWRKPRS